MSLLLARKGSLFHTGSFKCCLFYIANLIFSGNVLVWLACISSKATLITWIAFHIFFNCRLLYVRWKLLTKKNVTLLLLTSCSSRIQSYNMIGWCEIGRRIFNIDSLRSKPSVRYANDQWWNIYKITIICVHTPQKNTHRPGKSPSMIYIDDQENCHADVRGRVPWVTIWALIILYIW